MKKYSGYTYDDLQERIVKDWDSVYSDCRIVAFSMERDVALVHALVVFEEMGLHHFGRFDEDWSEEK
jgi:hypothetical protein